MSNRLRRKEKLWLAQHGFFIRQDCQDITRYFIFYFHNFPDESNEE